ncbi:GntR family transcriptional regulator [Streptomyces sp. NPDC001851]|uniref:GntR family transcriptional regulator n=1 Tax=Streptomyces sp. NPDC001851 TaxID=3154529 RepID=UPI003321069F
MTKAAKWEQTAEAVRQEIQARTYAQGVTLNVGELSRKYSTTKPTVAKALDALVGDGLVVKDGDAWKVGEGLFAPEPEFAVAPVVQDTAEDLVARMAAKAEAKTRAANGKVAVRESPQVLEGRVVTEHVDPNAERALKREDVAEAYQEAKVLGREWLAAEGRATEAKKAVAVKLMDLRAMFTYKGDPDYNGQSPEYQAVAKLLYQDIGADASAQRAILHHVEDRKRAVIPPAQWAKFGVDPLTRGERAGLEKKTAKALTTVADTAKAAASQARKGKATGHQLVTLMSRIDQGMAVFSTASLRVMSPAERRKFREQAEETKARAEALLQELEGLED